LIYNEAEDICIIGWKASTTNSWLLGAAFHRGNYVIYDDENSRIGIGPARFFEEPVKEEIKKEDR